MSIWRFADWLIPCDPSSHMTLGEGDTPLVHSRAIGPAAGLNHLYFKVESSNPTGSYKDRFAAAAVSHMLAAGKRRCIATSSGNTGSALAAYCAAAGIACEIAIVATTPDGKLKQMMAYGAELYKVENFGIDPEITEQVIAIITTIGNEPDAQFQISAFQYSPDGMNGVQTIGYELVEQAGQIGRPIDHVFSCAGGGGLTLAVARGLERAVEETGSGRSPAVHCVQPEGNNTIAGPLREGLDRARPCECTTQISGLQVAHVIDGHNVITACRSSGGTGYVVHDEEIWNQQARLAREEGIFCEPAAAVPLAGAMKAAEEGRIDADDVVVCLVTGIGFKDEAAVDAMVAGDDCPTISLQEMRARISAA
jgi:threonine synthase